MSDNGCPPRHSTTPLQPAPAIHTLVRTHSIDGVVAKYVAQEPFKLMVDVQPAGSNAHCGDSMMHGTRGGDTSRMVLLESGTGLRQRVCAARTSRAELRERVARRRRHHLVVDAVESAPCKGDVGQMAMSAPCHWRTTGQASVCWLTSGVEDERRRLHCPNGFTVRFPDARQRAQERALRLDGDDEVGAVW